MQNLIFIILKNTLKLTCSDQTPLRRRVKLILLSPFFIVFLVSPLLAKPQLSKSFRPQWGETLLQFESYHSTANYDKTGKVAPLPSAGGFWASTGFDFAGRYVFSHRLAATTGLSFVNSQANQASTTRYNEGVQNFRGSIEYKIPSTFADFIAEGHFQLSLYKPNEAILKPLYGDGAHEGGGSFWILQKFGAFYWHGKAGLLFRSDGLSSHLPHQVGLHWRFSPWTLSSVLDGTIPISADTMGENQRHSYLQRSNAGSWMYRSANPTRYFLDFQMKYEVTNQFGFNGGWGTSILGKNSSHGTRFFIGIDIYWPPTATINNKSPLKNTLLPSKSPTRDEEEWKQNETTIPLSL